MSGAPMFVWLCAAIAVAVFAAMIGCIITFHDSNSGSPARMMYSKGTEILWALIPIAILAAIAIPAIRTLVFVDGRGGS